MQPILLRLNASKTHENQEAETRSESSQHVESQTELLKRNFEVRNKIRDKCIHLFLRMLYDLKRYSCLHE